LDSSMLSTRFGVPIALLLPSVLLLEAPELLLPATEPLLRLWLMSCQGTGISLPVVLEEYGLLELPETLERLEGTVSRPEVDVSDALPADESERIANWMRPLCGSTNTSWMLPRVLPS
jgi:hypothetical protein